MPAGGNFTSCNCGPDVTACESPTQPVATVGLCLADGTPIAVTVVRDCAGTVTSEGWLNLVTGAWSAGAPPAGVIACGDSRSITTNGTFCDVLEDGTVAGLVLVEYQYAADGSIDSVRLVDAVTGDTYTPTGEVTTCPAGVEQPERDILQLCDVAEDGTSTPFVRDYARDENGTITGHTDYALDGQPYTPAGTVGLCAAETAEPCASAVTMLRLCDLDPDVEPDEDGKRCATPFLRHLVYDCAGAVTETRDTTPDGTTPYTPVQVVDCGSGGVPAMVEVPWEVVSIEPDPASAQGRGLIFSLSPIDDPDTVGTVTVTTSSSYGTSSCPADPPAYAYRNPTQYTFRPDQALRDAATYVRCDLIDFDTFEPVTGLNPPPDRLGGTAYWDGTTVRPTDSNQTGEMYYDGPPEVWTYRVGNTGGGNSCSMLSFAAVSLRPEGCCAPCGSSGGGEGGGRTVQEVCVIANTAPDDVMHWTRVIEDGGATIYYLDQDGARYDNTLPAGHQIVACPAAEEEPCRNTQTVLLCDTEEEPEEPTPTVGEPTVTNLVPPAPLPPGGSHVPQAGGATLWSGGTLVIPADPNGSAGDGSQVYRTVAATLSAPRPACDDGTATVTASVHVHLDGPASTGGYGGALRLFDGAGTMIGEQGPPSSVAPGYDAVLTVTGDVSAADLEAGNVTVWLALETFQSAGKGWTVDGFEAAHVFNAPAEPCEEPESVQFLRTLVTDCTTGEIVSVVDTTLDGQPYTATGAVGQCTPVGSGGEVTECQSCDTLTLCDVQPDESPGEPEIAYETVPLAELGPAGSYGDGSPVTGTLPNGVGYSVNVGEWAAPQGHYTFYPGDGPQTWTFTEPVYVRFGLRGLNITPTECYIVPEGAVAESISPNHTWDPDSRALCEITGQSAADDESVFLLGPVTELPLTASGSSTGGRGPGLIQAGLPVEAPAPGSSASFLRTICRDCQGQVLSVTDTELDGETPYTPTGEVTTCGSASGGGEEPTEPCRNTSSTLLCDTADQEPITVFDPANVPGSDGWQVVSYETVTGNPAEAPIPYDAPHPPGPFLGARTDLSAGSGPAWTGYDTAPHRWVLRKTFTAPEDGIATVSSTGFRGDGGARVRVNGQDAGMYGQWNQPATSGTAQIPVTAGPNVVEIEVRDGGGNNWVQGRLDIVMVRTVQFMRHQTVDCETGDVLSITDTTLDGEPYEVTGEVGQCTPVAECCEQPPPELRVDVESDVMCIRDQDGEITGQVVVERVYDDQSGARAEQRLTDPTTGEPVELPAGAELVLCQEPPCPVAFATECVGAVTRTEAAYDNTSLIGGVPGKCGSVQGPNGQFPCQPTTGALTITSWIVDGEEVIGEGGGRSFNGGPCGEGTTATPGMHHNWALALTNLDPAGADWSAQEADGCAWFVGSTGGTNTVYGAMTVVDAEGRQWILGPAQACEETQFTKVYSQECDGTVSVSWLDAQGVPTEAPEGDLVPCGTGCGTGGGAGLDVEVLELCDVAADGSRMPFLRHITYGTGGQVSVVLDTALDGFAPYTPSGTVTVCQPDPAPDVELLALCDIAEDDTSTPFLRHLVYQAGASAPTVLDTLLDGATPYTPTGEVSTCEPTPDEECRSTSTLLLCDTEDTPAAEAVPLSTLADAPPAVSGTLSNGVGWTVSAGRWADAAAGYSVSANAGQINPPGPQAWTFDQPVHLRVGIVGLNQEECVQLPGGLVVESLDPGHTWNPASNRLCGLPGTAATAMTVLTSTSPVTSLVWDVVDEGVSVAAAVGVGLLELAPVPEPVQFLRHVVVDCDGVVQSMTDTTLDGQPYTVAGEVGQCTTANPETPETPEEECPSRNVLSACRCDDADGDGVADTGYVELLAVDCDGVLTSVGTYTEDLAAPYTPVAPVDCATGDPGPEPVVSVQAHRVQLAPGQSWDASTVAALRSVTLTAHTGDGLITTGDGVSTLFQGESVSWSINKDVDAELVGPLTVDAVDGVITVTWTRTS